MLKGKTTMKVTKATVIAAVQEYLDETFVQNHVVTNVQAESGYADTFTIELDDGATAAKTE